MTIFPKAWLGAVALLSACGNVDRATPPTVGGGGRPDGDVLADATDAHPGPGLAQLALSAGRLLPAHDEGIHEYQVAIPALVATIELSAVPSSPGTSIRVGEGSEQVIANRPAAESGGARYLVSVPEGSTAIELVLDEGGQSSTYRVEITRAELTQTFVKAPAPQEGERWGDSIAGAPDRFAVGNCLPDSPGKVDIYERSDAGWSHVTALEPPAARGDLFRAVAAASDGRVVIRTASPEALTVVERTANDFEELGSVITSRPLGLGAAALAGATLAAGTSDASSGDTVAVVEVHDVVTGELLHELEDPDAPGQTGFGWALALSEDTLAVGAPASDAAGREGAGVVHVYERASTSAFELVQTLTPSHGEAGAAFGGALSMRGDLLVATAQDAAEDGQAPGAVYVYERAADEWLEKARLRISADEADSFALRVALGAGTVAVAALDTSGAVGIDPDAGPPVPIAGAVHLFERRPEAFPRTHSLKELAHLSGGTTGFATELAFAENALIVTAPFDASRHGGIGADPDNEDLLLAGAVHLFE